MGTGLNAPKGFDTAVAEAVSELTGKAFVTAPNKFHALTSKDELVFAHGALKALAADLMKIANDVRWLASGPRCGLGEIQIPENEPGSSIMPGKVNPTQCEAVTMVAVQVMGNDAAVGIAASQGNFELNVFMPVCAYNFLQSVRLLSEAIASFDKNCASGIRANRERMDENVRRSLMLVTALNPHIGYENAARIAKKAYAENLTLREACAALELLPPEDGKISQKTEDLVGPYELHDFYLYHMLRLGFAPKKVYRLAKVAFDGVYDDETILKWLKTFYRRFFAQQFKRSCLPDGPKVGSVALSPRGDWRMPSDACAALWLKELEQLQ